MYGGDQRTMCETQFSPSILWRIRTELRLASSSPYIPTELYRGPGTVSNSLGCIVSKRKDCLKGHLTLPWLLSFVILSLWRVGGETETLTWRPVDRVLIKLRTCMKRQLPGNSCSVDTGLLILLVSRGTVLKDCELQRNILSAAIAASLAGVQYQRIKSLCDTSASGLLPIITAGFWTRQQTNRYLSCLANWRRLW